MISEFTKKLFIPSLASVGSATNGATPSSYTHIHHSKCLSKQPVLKTAKPKGKQIHQLVHIYSNISLSQVCVMQVLAIILLIVSVHEAKAKYFLVETTDNEGNNFSSALA